MKTHPPLFTNISFRKWISSLLLLLLTQGAFAADEPQPSISSPSAPKIFVERPPAPSTSSSVVAPEPTVTSAPMPMRPSAALPAVIESMIKDYEAEESELLRERKEILAEMAETASGAIRAKFVELEQRQRARLETLRHKKRKIEELLAAHREINANSQARSGTVAPMRPAPVQLPAVTPAP